MTTIIPPGVGGGALQGGDVNTEHILKAYTE